jgi:hypothetical protein
VNKYKTINLFTKKLYKIGPTSVEIIFFGLKDTDNFTKAITHLEVELLQNIDLTIFVSDEIHGNLKLPLPTWEWSSVDEYGNIPTYDLSLLMANFIEMQSTFCTLNFENKIATYWTYDTLQLPEWERSFPFRSIFHNYWQKDPNLLTIHAGAVGFGNGGVLLTGKGGSGKSTAALSCLDSNLLYAGDDLMLIDTNTCMIYSLYNVAKLEAHQLKLFPHFEPLIYNHKALPVEKAQLFLHEYFPEKVISMMPLKAIVLPKFSGETNTTWTRASSAEALIALAPSSIGVFQEKAKYLNKIAKLCRLVPIYKLGTGTNLNQIPLSIVEILNDIN